MKTLGLAVSLLLCAAVSLGFATPQRRLIYVVNTSTLVSEAQIREALPVFQSQIDRDLGPAWNVDAELVYADPPNPQDWRITLTDTPACWACGGYHDIYQGTVEAEVAASSDREWQVSFSHELTELLVDPYIHDTGDGARFVLAGKRLWLVEVGDPVEDMQYAYERNGVLLSDFTLPNYYRPRSVGPWDFGRHVKRPLQILDGGYGWYMLAGKWVEV